MVVATQLIERADSCIAWEHLNTNCVCFQCGAVLQKWWGTELGDGKHLNFNARGGENVMSSMLLNEESLQMSAVL